MEDISEFEKSTTSQGRHKFHLSTLTSANLSSMVLYIVRRLFQEILELLTPFPK